MSKQIDPIQNTDRQKTPKLYHVIDIGCHYDKHAYKFKPLERHVIPLNPQNACKCSTWIKDRT